MLTIMLQRMGYEVETTLSGEEAWAVLSENPGYFDLVITDQNMPKMTGAELARKAAEKFPDLPFIIVSGYSRQKLEDVMTENPSVRAILRKPVSKEKMQEVIETVLTTL
jgi:CheY-like chemotaxis protein